MAIRGRPSVRLQRASGVPGEEDAVEAAVSDEVVHRCLAFRSISAVFRAMSWRRSLSAGVRARLSRSWAMSMP
jgi:hypothetical protein